jgi:hypothetical protein
VAEAIVSLLVALTCVVAVLLYRARKRAADRRRWWPGDAEGVREFRSTPRSSVPMVPSVVLQSVAPASTPPIVGRTPRASATSARTMAAAIRGRGNAVAASRFVESQNGVRAPRGQVTRG